MIDHHKYEQIRSFLLNANYKNTKFDKFIDQCLYYAIVHPTVFEEENELTASWREGENYAEFSVDDSNLITYIIRENGELTGKDDINVDDAIFMLRQSFVYQIK